MCVAVHFYLDVPWTGETERFCKYSVIYVYTIFYNLLYQYGDKGSILTEIQELYWKLNVTLSASQ